MSVTLNNTIMCSLDDGSGITYVSNTGRIARISDRVDLSNDPKTVEHRPETVNLDRPGIDCKHGSDINGANS